MIPSSNKSYFKRDENNPKKRFGDRLKDFFSPR